MSESEVPFVSRGGVKLAAALDRFGVEAAGKVCADLGSHVGGFVDCLLQRGAARVYSIDTAYGTLAWKLRKDERVVVMERVNAMHMTLPEQVELATTDVGWTRQAKVLPRLAKFLKPDAVVITLIKPHYEAESDMLTGGVLDPQYLDEVLDSVSQRIIDCGFIIEDMTESPLAGHGGNRESLALLRLRQETT